MAEIHHQSKVHPSVTNTQPPSSSDLYFNNGANVPSLYVLCILKWLFSENGAPGAITVTSSGSDVMVHLVLSPFTISVIEIKTSLVYLYVVVVFKYKLSKKNYQQKFIFLISISCVLLIFHYTWWKPRCCLKAPNTSTFIVICLLQGCLQTWVR